MSLFSIIVDWWARVVGSPHVDEWQPATECADEDVPIVPSQERMSA